MHISPRSLRSQRLCGLIELGAIFAHVAISIWLTSTIAERRCPTRTIPAHRRAKMPWRLVCVSSEGVRKGCAVCVLPAMDTWRTGCALRGSPSEHVTTARARRDTRKRRCLRTCALLSRVQRRQFLEPICTCSEFNWPRDLSSAGLFPGGFLPSSAAEAIGHLHLAKTAFIPIIRPFPVSKPR
jgi:hypothetical protein